MDITGKTIFISLKADKPVVFAAQELAKYIKLVTGQELWTEQVELAENVLIVASSPAGVNTDGNFDCDDHFKVKGVNDAIVFTSSTARGVLYSVYEFARDYLGMRFVYSGEDLVTENKKPMIAGIAIDKKPRCPVILSSFMEVLSGRNDHTFTESVQFGKKYIDWMGKNYMNATQWSISIVSYDPYRDHFLEEFQKRGIDLLVGGHAFKYFIPPEEYAKDHLEWFSVIDGERNTAAEYCYSNEHFRKELIEKAIDFYVNRYPELSYAPLSGNDSPKFCECENCAKKTPFEWYFDFLVEIHNALQKHRKDLKVVYLAYNVALKAEALKIPENIKDAGDMAMGFAYWGRDYSQPFETSTNQLDIFGREQLEDWCGRGYKPLLWEYYGSATQFTWAYVPLTKVIPADVDYYVRQNVSGVAFHEHPIGEMLNADIANTFATKKSDGSGFDSLAKMDHATYDPFFWHLSLNRFVFARSWWDSDIEPALADYYDSYYGIAANEIRHIFEAMEKGFTPLTKYNANPDLFPSSFSFRIWSTSQGNLLWDTAGKEEWKPKPEFVKANEARIADTEAALEVFASTETFALEAMHKIGDKNKANLLHAIRYYYFVFGRLKAVRHQFMAQKYIIEKDFDKALAQIKKALSYRYCLIYDELISLNNWVKSLS